MRHTNNLPTLRFDKLFEIWLNDFFVQSKHLTTQKMYLLSYI